MKKIVWLVGLIVGLALPAAAQEEFPTAELFGGFSYARLDFDLRQENAFGFQTSLSVNLLENLGVTGEFSGQFKSIASIGVQTYQFLIGPRVAARGERLTGFAHALFGSVHARARGIGSGTDFAMGFGGGADVKLSEIFAIRVVQFDYIPVRSAGVWLHNFRLGAGVVIRMGGGY